MANAIRHDRFNLAEDRERLLKTIRRGEGRCSVGSRDCREQTEFLGWNFKCVNIRRENEAGLSDFGDFTSGRVWSEIDLSLGGG